MSDLPDGWAEASVSELTDAGAPICYGVLKPGERDDAVVPMVRVTDIRGDVLERSQLMLISHQLDEEFSRSRISGGDVLLSIQGTVGRVAVVPDDMPPANISRTIARIRPASLDLSRWLWAALRAPQMQEAMGEETGGTTRDSLNIGALRDISVRVPPLAEQRRIGAKLDALTTRTARARADLDRIPALAARYKQAVLAKAFNGELTAEWRTAQSTLEPVSPRGEPEIRAKYRLDDASAAFSPPYEAPDTWRWLRLPELGDMDRGKSRHRPRDDARLFGGPFPFVQTGEVRAAERYLTFYSKTYSAFGLEQSKLWLAGTVCITIAANIAETAILGIDACFPDSVVGFSADPARCLPAYVEYFIRTAKADLEQFAPATAQKNINLEVLGSIRLPVAPLDEQAEIIRRIDRAFTEIDRMTTEAAAAIRLLRRLDRAVLAQAFRGELVPQDPADEPASVLLDRIRAERANAPKATRGRRKAVAA